MTVQMLYISALGKTRVAITRDDDMVMYGYPKDFPCFDQLLGHSKVFLTRLRISAGMIVNKDDACRFFSYGNVKALSRMNE